MLGGICEENIFNYNIYPCNENLRLVVLDVPGAVLDLVLDLVYRGWVGGLGLSNISQVRDVCKILDMRQEDFVVRSEDKYR